MSVVVLAGYRFFEVLDPQALRKLLKQKCALLNLKGSILVSPEGINAFISLAQEDVDRLNTLLFNDLKIPSFTWKVNVSSSHPFQKFLVKLKKEIITTGVPGLKPHEFTGPTVKPETLKNWLDHQQDLVLLDTRNDYEVQRGKFKGAIDLNVKSFREFSSRVHELPEDLKSKKIVMYCTGGIRCEKASALLLKQHGFKEVYQLEGGILDYFEKVGGDHYEGDCFVFDDRDRVHTDLQPAEKTCLKTPA
jgi:predicted sulfurtransferase